MRNNPLKSRYRHHSACFKSHLFFVFAAMIFLLPCCWAQEKTIDSFESVEGWRFIASEGVTIAAHPVPGVKGNALCIDFDFRNGTGYCGIQKQFPTTLPENYRFSFYLRGEAPRNNLEFKLIDASGDNVWWRNQRQYDFPNNWRKIVVKKRHISFAWGPTLNQNLTAFDKMEIFIASSSGGKGSLYLDELTFQELEPAIQALPHPRVSVSPVASSSDEIAALTDDRMETSWFSAWRPVQQQIEIDPGRLCELGGLTIDWDERDFARQYKVESSLDGINWETVYAVSDGLGGRNYIPLKELESRHVRLMLEKASRNKGYGIKELTLREVGFSETPEALYAVIARDAKRGRYPRYLLGEQSYWTILGVPGDRKEALINEDGSVEVDKNGFSIEPFVSIDHQLYSWADVEREQILEEGFLPIPTVMWRSKVFQLDVTAFATGRAGGARLFIRYVLKNRTGRTLHPDFLLAIRPFQVNPPWQFLNVPGGISPVRSLRRHGAEVIVNEQKRIRFSRPYNEFLTRSFEQGDISEFLGNRHWPLCTGTMDSLGFASGALRWQFVLQPGQEEEITLLLPFDGDTDPSLLSPAAQSKAMDSLRLAWRRQVDQVQFHLPPAGKKIIDVLRSNLAYILINRDGPGIQPGSRSYDRSWIRDGSLTSSALLRFGINEPVKEFLDWYAVHIYPSGKVPCVVDRRGPDPVPENDSNGQFIFALWQYYRFTGDVDFLARHFEKIRLAVAYMDSLTLLRSSDYYRQGNDSLQAFYGLVPESISHEGYSAKPMHSYWDDFFVLLGYKNAVEIAKVLDRTADADAFAASRDRFQENLYRSIDLAIKNNKIDFIPGCVELADFDATSTAVALFPCNEWQNLPQPQGKNTFDRYFDYFTRRLDPRFSWKEYTPYEVRLIGAFLRMGEPERAWRLVDFFMACQRPAGWNHWAEVVWKEERMPRFIGDMPHTWVGSDFVNSVRAMFVYEDEWEKSLVIGAGLPAEWIDASGGVQVRHMPTYYGLLDYTVERSGGIYHIVLSGLRRAPEGGISIRWWREEPPNGIIINGVASDKFDQKWIKVGTVPAVIEIR